MTNTVRIDIEVNAPAATADAASKRVSAPFVGAAADIDRAFDKTSKQLATSLDKIEKEAWQSGRGTGEAFDTAMTGLRRGLELAREEAAQTGQGLRSSLGDSLNDIRKSAERLADSIKPVAQATIPVNQNWEKTGRLISTELDRIERDAWESGRSIDRSFARTLAEVREDFERIRAEGKKTGASLESELGESLLAIKQRMASLREDTRHGSSGLGDILGDALSGGADAGSLAGSLIGSGGAWAAAGAAAAGFLWKGIEAESAEDRIGGLLAAQTGAAASAAEGLGNTAGEVFADNFGENIEQVGEAMKAVFENKLIDTTAAQGDIEKVTEKVITLSQVTGEGFDRISQSASRMVKTGIAGSVDEALDLIGRAQEKGLNASQDLLDTLTEYSTKFRDLGLNGAESLGLINQAMEGGARNTDVAADALKEFAIRAQDMSVLTRRGFETIGLDADVMGQRIAAGGASAKGALQDTLNALEAMPPGIQRNSAAVDLFGTKAEDLGKALYDMDLDTAAKEFGEFGGTVEEQMKKISDAQTFWDKLGKGISNAASAVGEWLDEASDVEIPEEMKGMLEEINKAQQSFDSTGSTRMLDDLKEKYPEAANAIDKYIDKKRDEKSATDDATESTSIYVDTLDELINKQNEAAGGVLGLSEATIAHEEALDAADQALKDNGKTLDLTTEKGRNNQSALNDLASTTFDVIAAMRAQGATAQDVQGYMTGARQSFIDHAIAMGMDATQANILADKLNLIPGTYAADVIVNSGQAVSALNAVRVAIAGIPRNVNIAVQQTLHAVTGKASGGIVSAVPWGAATGGQRHGSTMIDEVGPEIAELPNGTRMLTAGATRAMGEAGLLGGGGGGVVELYWAGSSEPIIDALMRGMRYRVLDRHGGSVSQALGKRGVA